MGNLRPDSSKNNAKAQSALEYFLIYGWALLLISMVAALLYLFITTPSSIIPSSCTFSSSTYCQDLILSSNTASSVLGLFLTNTEPYPIISPQIKVNFSSGQVTGTCRPYYVLPGGDIICNVTSPYPMPQGTLTSGTLFLSSLPCQSGNVVDCQQNALRQTYLGNFNTHVSPMISSNAISISLAVLNQTQFANSGYDRMTATVKLYGTPILGATVNFTSDSLSSFIVPVSATTNGNGNATSFISNPNIGTVTITASFANTIATDTITFVQAINVTFQLSPQTVSTLCVPQNGGLSVLMLDSVPYTCSQLPITLPYQAGTQHPYSFIASGVGYLGLSYAFNSISGCGTSGSSGTLTVPSSNCNVTASYASASSTTTTITSAICASSLPVFSSFVGDCHAAEVNPQETLYSPNGVYGYIDVDDAGSSSIVTGTWIWDFGSVISGTFAPIWYLQDATPCPTWDYTDVTATWYASVDGNSWTVFDQQRIVGTDAWSSIGSSSSPLTSQITGSYRYIKFDLYSSKPSMACDAEGYVDSVCVSP